MQKLLYIGLKNDYGSAKRGLSYEYRNFLETLRQIKSFDVDFFPVDEILRLYGRKKMNQLLLKKINIWQPDICFFVLFTDEVEKETLRLITKQSNVTTLNWFTDYHWRFDTFSKYWAPLFHWTITTDQESLERYYSAGCKNVILSQWGFNHRLLREEKQKYLYDVTFIGQVHSSRKRRIEELRERDIEVQCWGKGWKRGTISSEGMIERFKQSKINLNFTGSSSTLSLKRLAKILLNRRCDNTFQINSLKRMSNESKVLMRSARSQIKGRNFEIPGHGGFLLTDYADHLDRYYIPENEIAVFHNYDELVEKISYYLCHDEEREKIRLAGQQRTLRDHTYEKRFKEIFTTMGIPK